MITFIQAYGSTLLFKVILDYILVFLIILVGLVLHKILFYILKKIEFKDYGFIKDSLIKNLLPPSRFFFPLLCLLLAMPILTLQQNVAVFLNRFINIGFIGVVAWVLIKGTHIFQDVLLNFYNTNTPDNLKAAKIHTQIKIIQQIIIFVIIVIASASILMTFDSVRQLGISILASAGLLGIMLGFAAQKSVATLLAGIQIALTQPIRIDDVLIVEKEWGRVEEITLTYVVLEIWDCRRLIIPITYFIEKPFENWTRSSAELIGSVFLYVDYSIPISEVRTALKTILQSTKLWDGKVENVQVTNATEKVLELRALMSAKNSSNCWDLRCLVREKLIEFVQTNYPGCLPHVRAKIEELELPDL